MSPAIIVSGDARDRLAVIAARPRQESGRAVTFGDVVDYLLTVEAAGAA